LAPEAGIETARSFNRGILSPLTDTLYALISAKGLNITAL